MWGSLEYLATIMLVSEILYITNVQLSINSRILHKK